LLLLSSATQPHSSRNSLGLLFSTYNYQLYEYEKGKNENFAIFSRAMNTRKNDDDRLVMMMMMMLCLCPEGAVVQPLRLLDDLQQLVVGPHALEVLRDGASGLWQRVSSEECLDLVSFLRGAEATEMTLSHYQSELTSE